MLLKALVDVNCLESLLDRLQVASRTMQAVASAKLWEMKSHPYRFVRHLSTTHAMSRHRNLRHRDVDRHHPLIPIPPQSSHPQPNVPHRAHAVAINPGRLIAGAR
jgi:hypothetical protein